MWENVLVLRRSHTEVFRVEVSCLQLIFKCFSRNTKEKERERRKEEEKERENENTESTIKQI